MSDVAQENHVAAQPGVRRADDTAALRLSILLGLIEQFALDPRPKRGEDVFRTAVVRAGVDVDLSGPIVKSGIMLLVKGGLLTCNTFDPMTGFVVFDADTVLRDAPILECFMTFVLDDPSNARSIH